MGKKTVKTKSQTTSKKTAGVSADSIVELAVALNVSRQTISTWRKKFADAPKPRSNGKHSLKAWVAFMRKHSLKADGFDEKDATEAEILRGRKLKAEVELAEHKVAVAKGRFVSVERVREVWGLHISQARKTLENKFLNELPPTLAVMEDAVAIREEMQKVIDATYAELQDAASQMSESEGDDE